MSLYQHTVYLFIVFIIEDIVVCVSFIKWYGDEKMKEKSKQHHYGDWRKISLVDSLLWKLPIDAWNGGGGEGGGERFITNRLADESIYINWFVKVWMLHYYIYVIYISYINYIYYKIQ